MPSVMTPSTFALLLAFAVVPAVASAQVHRCTRSDGTAVFTDRKCNDVGASESLPRSDAPARALRQVRGGCARNLQDLVYEMTTAIDAQDANRLAGVYHWVGMSSSTAEALMARLDAIVRRPLVDIAPVVPRAPEEDAGVLADADYFPQTSVRHAPTALRVEQTLPGSVTPSATVFGLRRHLGCLWITL